MLSVVVPTYNERDNVTELCDRIGHSLASHEFEVIFVDDSSDDTPLVLEGLAQRHPYVRFEHRVGGGGLSSAVVRGFELAQGSSIAVMDGDLQHPPELLSPMYEVMERGADFCITSRFIPGGTDGGLSLLRKFVSWTARMIGKAVLPSLRPVTDPTTGFFMVKADVVEGVHVSSLGWKILVELLAVCRYHHIVEIPMVFSARKSGTTKFSGKPTFQYLEQLFILRRRAVHNEGVVVERLSSPDCAIPGGRDGDMEDRYAKG